MGEGYEGNKRLRKCSEKIRNWEELG